MTPIYFKDVNSARKLAMWKSLFDKNFYQPSNNKDEKESMVC